MKSYRRNDQLIADYDWKYARKVEDDAMRGKIPMLSEMAIPLKTFLAQADGLGWQIAINWCLCKWCQLYNPECINFDHWKDELATHLIHLNRLNIKNRIDKHKHLHKIWISDYDFNDKTTVLKIIANKFYKERINDVAQRDSIAEAFTQCVEEVINVISSPVNEIMQYIEDEFNSK